MRTILIVLVLFSVMPAQAKLENKAAATQKERYQNLELFQRVLHYVESNYVDKVSNEKLIHGAIKGMLQTLDPHSNFLPQSIFKDMRIDTSGKFGGLGIEIGIRDNVLTVITPIEDTPAWKAGLKPGDRIVRIEGESTKGMDLSQAVAKMRGKRGSKLKITIFRKGFSKVKDVEIVRDTIRIRAVNKVVQLADGYGYIHLGTFNDNAARDVKRALAKLEKKKKLSGLVFDLRRNPGGLLDQAVEVTSLFLESGVVVSTVGRNRDQKEVKHAIRGGARTDFPIAVLVSSSTASAAEIVAGALQDHKRAIILGQPSFGKGSVQTVVELGSDIGLKLTIARYYTPNGQLIQEKGVQPDILLDEFDKKLLDKARITKSNVREKDLPGHLINSDFTSEELGALGGKKKQEEEEDLMAPVKIDPKEDYQVQQALNYLKSFAIFNDFNGNSRAIAGDAKASAIQ